MDAFTQEQFWAGLTRLYETTVKLGEDLNKLAEAVREQKGTVDKLAVTALAQAEAVRDLKDSVRDLKDTAQAHENRLRRLEGR